jgi:hypothetical protein
MNTPHTPGPWNLDETTGVNMLPVYLIESAEGQSIARVNRQSDALLIRSAPTLLAQRNELREALEYLLWLAEQAQLTAPECSTVSVSEIDTICRKALSNSKS